MNAPDSPIAKLEVWIAENLFGWEWKQTGSDPVEDGYCWHDGYGKFPCDLPDYATDPAAAMLVLEKCAVKIEAGLGEMDCVQIQFWNGQWHVVNFESEIETSTADTLPLAICQFAKKLFAK